MSLSKKILHTISEASKAQYLNPYTMFQWPAEIDKSRWCMPPELISLHGTELFTSLSLEKQRQLSFFEITNLFSLTLEGEKMLIEKVARYLYAGRSPYDEATEYMQHFLDEETKHIVYFGEFCRRYAGKVYTNHALSGPPPEYGPGEEEFSTFVSILIFEEIGNYYNVAMATDDKIEPIVRQINAFHRREEARHLVFGRQIVLELFERYAKRWSEEITERVREYIASFVASTWRGYFNPDVYRDIGLDGAFGVYEMALESDSANARFQCVIGSCNEFLLESGILLNPLCYEN